MSHTENVIITTRKTRLDLWEAKATLQLAGWEPHFVALVDVMETDAVKRLMVSVRDHGFTGPIVRGENG